ncbi:MAG TPA: homoserine kinase [Vicinamibacterales bacterium]|nr:homoserine kinase [Vicinamibacterales bacterium]
MSLNTTETVRADAVVGEEIVVPGSVANLGGGFDTLGVAVELYLRARIVDVRDDGGTKLVVARSTPPVSGSNAVERAFGIAARRAGRRGPSVTIEVTSEIPMAAGLGSSAAATVAGLRVFERVTGALEESELLGAATQAEGHADNAAPALFGGLNSVIEIEGALPYALRWSWPQDLRLVVATPVVGLATAKARAALPREVPRADAIFNMQRVLALVHALQLGQHDRLREAVKDRLHQSARSSLVPLLREALALEDPDVLGAFLSGAGPSVALLARADVTHVAARLSSMYERAGVEATVRTLGVDDQGSRVLESGAVRRTV